MTIKEVRRYIAERKDQKRFEEATIVLALAYRKESYELNGVVAAFEHIERQYKGWQSFTDEELPDYLVTSKEFYQGIYLEFEEALLNSYDADDLVKELKYNLSLTQYKNNYLFQYHDPETIFLLNLHIKFPGSLEGAVSYLVHETIHYNDMTPKFLTGVLQAYEFRSKGVEFVEHSTAEEKSLEALRSEYNGYIKQARIDLDELFSATIERKKQDFNDWFFSTKKTFKEFDTASRSTIQLTEDLYKEKLKLEAPANYWKQRAINLASEGKKWMYWLIGASVIGIFALGAVLFFISDGTLKDLFEHKGSAIRWSVVFITFVSFLAFTVKTFAKLMFSAFHLHRDAEEREQLAYVYLSLKKDKSIDETERHLVMQSLFSRADSGLLKDDSSPKMPGGSVLEKVIGGK